MADQMLVAQAATAIRNVWLPASVTRPRDLNQAGWDRQSLDATIRRWGVHQRIIANVECVAKDYLKRGCDKVILMPTDLLAFE
jgi:hypothetical protein